MKIVFVTPLIDLGGGQRYITELANYWASNGKKVSIFVLRKSESFYNISDNVNIVKFDYQDSSKFSNLFNGLKIIIKLRKNIKQIKPDFVLSIVSAVNILTIISSLFLDTKVITRDVFSHTRNRKYFDKLGRKFFYRFANGMIAQTSEIKFFIEKETGCKNINVIPNPVRNFNSNTSVKKEKLIINVGRLNAQKGQKYFIEACSKINIPGWKFIVLGEGKLRKILENKIMELSVTNKVELPGAVKNVDDYLLKSSIFVFPSLYEGLPNALIEAMSAGLPCVSFDCETGPRDLINDGQNGFLVPVGDVDLLVSRIVELINDSELREKFSREAIKTTDKFKIEKISDKVLSFCSKS